MSEHWKSTPKYWCKYCSTYVRDTKLERQNHEATGKHQGALKRFLRDLHRGHERDERDKERAKREIERLNGVVGSSSGTASGGASRTIQDTSAKATAAQLAKQREQLAAMGIAMPGELRSEMAIAGEWTVTATKVIDDTERKKDDPDRIEARASGTRKREVTEEEREEEEALQGLFKKQKRWGGTRVMPEDDTDLDALLSGHVLRAPAATAEEEEDDDKTPIKEEEIANNPTEVKAESSGVKKEPVDDAVGLDMPEKDAAPTIPDAAVKMEEGPVDIPVVVVFKKRKSKNIRQK